MRAPAGGSGLKRIGRAVMGVSRVGAAARRIAALRGRSLVLVYHRLASGDVPDPVLVPTIEAALFRRHVEALGEIGRVVSLPELLERGNRRDPPRFAVTFDDDYPSHVGSALPILRDLGVPGTFFLSGRALHGAGPYWFESLERWVRERGLPEVTARLGIEGAGTEALVRACEMNPRLRRIVVEEAADGIRHLEAEDITTLVGSGMTIGFHTVDHPVLTYLSGPEIEAAVVRGRGELAAVVGAPLTLFAYPHGRADARAAAKVRDAGYAAGWTGRPRPMRPRDHRYLLGRWEPGPLSVDQLVVSAGVRLNRGGRRR